MFWQDYGKTEVITMMQTLGIIFLLTAILWFCLRKKSQRAREIPLVVITLLMLVLEAIKEISLAVQGDYSWWQVPLHFCSLFLYFYPLATLARGKVKDFGKTMSLVCSMWMVVLFYYNPSSIIGDSPLHVFQDYYKFHTFAHHHLVVLFLLVSLCLNVYNIRWNSLLHVAIGITAYALVAVPAAHLTGTNYCNLLTSNIPFMESLRQSAGQIVYTIVMWLIGIAGGVALCSSYIGINSLIKTTKNAHNKNKKRKNLRAD